MAPASMRIFVLATVRYRDCWQIRGDRFDRSARLAMIEGDLFRADQSFAITHADALAYAVIGQALNYLAVAYWGLIAVWRYNL